MNYFSPAASREEGKGKREEEDSGAPLEPIPAPPAAGPRFSFYPYLAAGLALVLLAAPWAVKGVEAVPVPLKQEFKHFPLQLGPWEGRHVAYGSGNSRGHRRRHSS